ncbi:MAG: hypothetical protein LCH99_11155 [Proteobacteria bacterium]|jgi:hypothetical protein|nr:hypothetical protein [Pseudomonadota bacterium]
MAIIISNHDTPLPLPGGIVLRPGARTNVARWDFIKNDDVVKSWVKAGLLTEEKAVEPEVAAGGKKKAD